MIGNCIAFDKSWGPKKLRRMTKKRFIYFFDDLFWTVVCWKKFLMTCFKKQWFIWNKFLVWKGHLVWPTKRNYEDLTWTYTRQVLYAYAYITVQCIPLLNKFPQQLPWSISHHLQSLNSPSKNYLTTSFNKSQCLKKKPLKTIEREEFFRLGPLKKAWTHGPLCPLCSQGKGRWQVRLEERPQVGARVPWDGCSTKHLLGLEEHQETHISLWGVGVSRRFLACMYDKKILILLGHLENNRQADMLFKEDNLQPAARLFALPWGRSFVVGSSVGSLDKSRQLPRSVSMNTRSNERNRFFKREEKQRPMFFLCVYVVGWSLFKDPQFDHCRRSWLRFWTSEFFSTWRHRVIWDDEWMNACMNAWRKGGRNDVDVTFVLCDTRIVLSPLGKMLRNIGHLAIFGPTSGAFAWLAPTIHSSGSYILSLWKGRPKRRCKAFGGDAIKYRPVHTKKNNSFDILLLGGLGFPSECQPKPRCFFISFFPSFSCKKVALCIISIGFWWQAAQAAAEGMDSRLAAMELRDFTTKEARKPLQATRKHISHQKGSLENHSREFPDSRDRR